VKKIGIFIALVLLVPAIGSGKEPAKPLTADTIHVLKIAAQEERAVIKTPDGKTQIIKVGDPIGDHAKVTEISQDRVVIQESKDKSNETETVIIRLVDGKQKVERIMKHMDKQPVKLVSSLSTTRQK
jgi:hypothetical protein